MPESQFPPVQVHAPEFTVVVLLPAVPPVLHATL